MDKFTTQLAIALKAAYAEDYAEYVAQCDLDSKAGYRAHYCEHGTNLWTDYDNICGGCESGVTMSDPLQRMQRAIGEAKRRVGKADRILALHNEARSLGIEDAVDGSKTMAAWSKLLDPRR